MPIQYLGILRNTSKPAVELSAERDLSKFNRFTRSKYSEFLDFFVLVCAERTQQGQRKTIDKNEGKDLDYNFHVYGYQGGLCGVVVTDPNYDTRVAQAILAKSLEAFTAKYPQSAYADLQPAPQGSPPPLALPELKDYIVKYEHPENIDPILKIQLEIDETKTYLHQGIESVLERGEKIDTLVAKSNNLSSQSKMFYTQAKKQNSCCVIM